MLSSSNSAGPRPVKQCLLPGGHGQHRALSHVPQHAVECHPHASLDDEKSLVLAAMAMRGAGLIVEYEQVFSAVSGPGLVGDPVFDQAGPGKSPRPKSRTSGATGGRATFQTAICRQNWRSACSAKGPVTGHVECLLEFVHRKVPCEI